jgi:hypothetical protein
MLDTDPEAIAAAQTAGLSEQPSEFYERHTGILLEDRMLLIIQNLVDDPTVGRKLINATWEVVRINDHDETLILSDRPLIRLLGYNDENAIWILPLNPRAAFVAANKAENIGKLRAHTANRIAKYINTLSANQTERFAFSVTDSHGRWLKKYLGP